MIPKIGKIDIQTAPITQLRQSIAGVIVSPYETTVVVRWRNRLEYFEITAETWQSLNYAIMRDDAVDSQHTEDSGELVMALHPNNYGILLPPDVRQSIAEYQWQLDSQYIPQHTYSRRPDGTFRKHQGR